LDGHLKGKVALITGGGTGLGADFTRRFVAEGAKVVITGRRREPLEKVAAGLPKDVVLIVQGDVSEPEQAKAMVDAAVQFGGKLEVLVNNAGIDPPGTVVEIPIEQWKRSSISTSPARF
jgi:NAD(P)-dependent dehydrogenase (short-subunit alcohol dehydrogenase family)